MSDNDDYDNRISYPEFPARIGLRNFTWTVEARGPLARHTSYTRATMMQ